MIDLLVIIQSFVHIRLAALAAPEQVPVMRLRLAESIGLQDCSDQLALSLDELENQVMALVHVARLLEGGHDGSFSHKD